MRDMEQTPSQLHANLEVLYSGTDNDYGAGYTDALAHVGGLVNGVYTPEVIAETQAEMLDPERSGYSESYVIGYTANWNRQALLARAALIRTNGYGTE